LGFTAAELGLGASLEGDAVRTMELTFPGGSGRWGCAADCFRQAGFPHHLVVLSDLSRALRDEERQAWQRLIRVMGHETEQLSRAHSIRCSEPREWGELAAHEGTCSLG